MEEKKIKSGLGGWLVLVAIYLIHMPVIFGVGLFDLSELISEPYKLLFKSPSLTLIENSLRIEILLLFTILITNLFLIYLFFKTKKNFPKLLNYFLLFYIGSFIILDVHYKLINIESYQLFDGSFKVKFFKELIYAFVLSVYISSSKRVKATFIN